jgi:CMP-N-acetylneuraminic acid synthetase
MSCLCIIPAKKNSKRLKNKNFKLFNNKPLIYWTIKVAKESGLFQDIIVSTDSKIIKTHAIKMEVKAPFLRPKIISKKNTPMSAVIEHALNHQRKIDKTYKYVCILQPTSPIRTTSKLKKVFNFFKNNNFDSLTTVKRLKHTSFPSFVFKDKNKISKKIIKNIQNKNQFEYKNSYYCLDGGYAFFTKTNQLYKDILGGKIGFFEISEIESQDIDNLDDFKIAEAIHKNIK